MNIFPPKSAHLKKCLFDFFPFSFRHLESKSLSCLLNYNTIELDAILVEICPKWNGPEDPEKLIKMQANHLKNHIGKKPKNCLLLKQKFREIAHLCCEIRI